MQTISEQAVLVALSTIRIAVAFIVIPIFSRNAIPGIVRNTMFFAMALITIVIHPLQPVAELSTMVWSGLFFKEVYLGLAIGVFYGLFLWAFEAAGVIIDTQIGMTFATSSDPIIGNEATLIGTFMGRWSVYIFVGTGGLTLLVGALLESFAIWPLLTPVDGLRLAASRLFEAELTRFMSLAVRIAAPVMIVLFLIDLVLGFINRSTQHFNVFFLSISIKGLASIVLLVTIIPFYVQLIVSEMATKTGQVENYIQTLIIGN